MAYEIPRQSNQISARKENRITSDKTQDIGKNNATSPIERLLREQEVAEIYNVGLSTVQQWRLKGIGPRYLKLGKSVRYRQADILADIQGLPSFTSTSAADSKR